MRDGRFLSQAADPLEPRDIFYYRILNSREETRRGYSTWAKRGRHETSRQSLVFVVCYLKTRPVAEFT